MKSKLINITIACLMLASAHVLAATAEVKTWFVSGEHRAIAGLSQHTSWTRKYQNPLLAVYQPVDEDGRPKGCGCTDCELIPLLGGKTIKVGQASTTSCIWPEPSAMTGGTFASFVVYPRPGDSGLVIPPGPQFSIAKLIYSGGHVIDNVTGEVIH